MTLQFPDDLSEFNVVTILVETRAGDNAYGNLYGTATAVVGYVEKKQHLTRAQSGDVTGSTRAATSTTFYGPVESAPLFTPGTRVTYLADTYEAWLSDVFTSSGLGLPDHVAVDLL